MAYRVGELGITTALIFLELWTILDTDFIWKLVKLTAAVVGRSEPKSKALALLLVAWAIEAAFHGLVWLERVCWWPAVYHIHFVDLAKGVDTTTSLICWWLVVASYYNLLVLAVLLYQILIEFHAFILQLGSGTLLQGFLLLNVLLILSCLFVYDSSRERPTTFGIKILSIVNDDSIWTGMLVLL